MATMLTPLEGTILVGICTVVWGIVKETRFTPKSTILFNVISMIVVLMTIELPKDFEMILLGYLGLSVVAYSMGGHQGIKQAVGSKSFGSFTIIISAMQYYNLQFNTILLIILWGSLSIGVYYAWDKFRKR